MKSTHVRAILAAAAVFAVASTLAPARALPGDTSMSSTSTGGTQGNGATPALSVPDTTSPAVALDGRAVAFSSDASNLVAGDTNGVADVFVRNLDTDRVIRVSVGSHGAQANGASYSPAMDVYGTTVAFVSEASNLVPGDTNGVADVFVRNLVTGSIKRISVSSHGAQANGASNTPFVSLYGQWITFESAATNLASGDANGQADAFIRDMKANTTARIAPPALKQADPAASASIWTDRAQVSYDGSVISFLRSATRNVPHDAIPVAPPSAAMPSSPSRAALPQPLDTLPLPVDPASLRSLDVPSAMDLFMLNRSTRKLRQVVLPPTFTDPTTGARFKQMYDEPALSASGRFVAFDAWTVVDHDDAIVRNPLDYKNVFVYDSVVKAFLTESAPSWPGVRANGDSYHPSINAGGTVVAFTSEATNLVSGDTNGLPDVFVRDAPARTTSDVSLRDDGTEANGGSDRASISYEGRRVFFASDATNLAVGDGNKATDVFERDRRTDTINHAPNFPCQVHPKDPKHPDDPCDAAGGVRSINVGQQYSLRLQATDADTDPIAYSLIYALAQTTPGAPASAGNPNPGWVPAGAAINRTSGVFTWTPAPNQIGPWMLVFVAADPRGNYHLSYAKIIVRDPAATATCAALKQCG